MNSAMPNHSATSSAAATASVSASASVTIASQIWRGKFAVAHHRIERPSIQAAWLRDDGSQFIGEGSLELELDARGEASGNADGVLGRQRVSGALYDDVLTLSLTPHVFSEVAFSGTARCEAMPQDGAKPRDDVAPLRCMLSMSSGDGNWVRTGTAILRRHASPPTTQ